METNKETKVTVGPNLISGKIQAIMLIMFWDLLIIKSALSDLRQFSNLRSETIFRSQIWDNFQISDLRQFLAAKSPLKMMKNAFYFMSKALFVLELSTFLSWIFGYVEKWLDKKVIVNFKIYNVLNYIRNNHNTHSSNISRSKGNQAMKFDQLTNYCMKNIFKKKSCRKWGSETSSRPLFVF